MKMTNNEYGKFLNEIKSRIVSARIQAVRSVNRELIRLYWDIGKSIVERQEKFGWGKGVVEQLSRDLTRESADFEGYSRDNLWRMRLFYREYKDNAKLAQLVPVLPWGHNILIMQKVKSTREREFYITAGIKFGWSRNVLLNQIKAGAYALSLKQKTHNFPQVLPAHLSEQADEAIKSVYNLNFLGITKPVLERELERRLVEKIKQFVLELGFGFSFIGNQYRLTLGDNEYFVDLLFYNRELKCLVALELKTGKFEPEYAGKMDFYLHLLDEQVRLKDENPSIGIILCADKDHVVVEYALRSVKKPVGVAEYYLTKKLPKALKGKLPDAKSLELPIQREFKNVGREHVGRRT
ncbi:MAG: PDDEXK nuclease domain-containing protein [Candidatus Margulisiibacteriota bacterium]